MCMCPIKLPSKLTIHKETWKFQYIVWPWASSLTTLLNRLVLNSCLRTFLESLPSFCSHLRGFVSPLCGIDTFRVETLLLKSYVSSYFTQNIHKLWEGVQKPAPRWGANSTHPTYHQLNNSSLWTPHNLTEAVGSTT